MPKVTPGAELLPESTDSYGKIKVAPRTQGALYFDWDAIYAFTVFIQLDSTYYAKNFPPHGIEVIRLGETYRNAWDFENTSPYVVVFCYCCA